MGYPAVTPLRHSLIGGGIIDPTTVSTNAMALDSYDPANQLSITSSADFVRANSEYLVNTSSDFRFGDEDFSVGGWFYFDDLTYGLAGLVSVFSGGSNRGWSLYHNNDALSFQLSSDGTSGTATTLVRAASITANSWYFITCVHDSVNDLLKMSINGDTFVTIAHSGGAWSGTTSNLKLGHFQAAGDYFDGRMDNIFIYKKALSQAEVSTLYSAGNGVNYNEIDQVSLMSLWGMNQESGPRFDSHAGYHLNDINTVGFTRGKVLNPASRAPIYKSAQFTAANSEFLSTSSKAYDFGDSDWSVGCWVNHDTVVALQAYVSKWKALTNDRAYFLGIDGGGKFSFQIDEDGTSANALSSTSAPTVGEWYFVVGVHDSVNDLIKLSINGSTFITKAHSGGTFDSTQDLRVGLLEHGGGTTYMNGRMGPMVFYNKALSQAEVTTLYDLGRGKNYSEVDTVDLVSYHSLAEVSGTRYDIHGLNNLSDNNTVTQGDGQVGHLYTDLKSGTSQSFTVAGGSLKADGAYNDDLCFKGGRDQTIKFRGKFKDLSVQTVILGAYKNSGNYRNFIIQSSTAGELTCRFFTNGSAQQIPLPSAGIGNIKEGVWYDIEFKYDSTNQQVWFVLDGVEKPKTQLALDFNPTPPPSIGTQLYLGGVENIGTGTDVDIDHVEIYHDLDKNLLYDRWNLDTGVSEASEINGIVLTAAFGVGPTATSNAGYLDVVSDQGKQALIGTWTDRKVGAKFEADSGAKMPTFDFDSRKLIFDGIGNKLDNTSLVATLKAHAQGEVMIIANRVSVANACHFFYLCQDGVANFGFDHLRDVTGGQVTPGAGAIYNAYDAAGTEIIYGHNQDGVANEIWLNGVEVPVIGPITTWFSSVALADLLSIGGRGSLSFTNFEIQAIYVFSEKLDERTREGVKNFANLRYSTFTEIKSLSYFGDDLVFGWKYPTATLDRLTNGKQTYVSYGGTSVDSLIGDHTKKFEGLNITTADSGTRALFVTEGSAADVGASGFIGSFQGKENVYKITSLDAVSNTCYSKANLGYYKRVWAYSIEIFIPQGNTRAIDIAIGNSNGGNGRHPLGGVAGRWVKKTGFFYQGIFNNTALYMWSGTGIVLDWEGESVYWTNFVMNEVTSGVLTTPSISPINPDHDDINKTLDYDGIGDYSESGESFQSANLLNSINGATKGTVVMKFDDDAGSGVLTRILNADDGTVNEYIAFGVNVFNRLEIGRRTAGANDHVSFGTVTRAGEIDATFISTSSKYRAWNEYVESLWNAGTDNGVWWSAKALTALYLGTLKAWATYYTFGLKQLFIINRDLSDDEVRRFKYFRDNKLK